MDFRIRSKKIVRVQSILGLESWFLRAMATTKLENEDILSDSLEFLGGEPVIDDSKILYGPLVLSLAPKVWSIP